MRLNPAPERLKLPEESASFALFFYPVGRRAAWSASTAASPPSR